MTLPPVAGRGCPRSSHLPQICQAFKYHPPHGDQPARYEQLRASAGSLAIDIDNHCPNSREKSIALTRLEEAVMWANAAIARNEPQPAAGPCAASG